MCEFGTTYLHEFCKNSTYQYFVIQLTYMYIHPSCHDLILYSSTILELKAIKG